MASQLPPPAMESVIRLLSSRWAAHGQCEATHPDGKASLRCVDAPGHTADHWSPMGVTWANTTSKKVSAKG